MGVTGRHRTAVKFTVVVAVVVVVVVGCGSESVLASSWSTFGRHHEQAFVALHSGGGQKWRRGGAFALSSSSSSSDASSSTATRADEIPRIGLNPLVSSVKVSQTVEIFSRVKQLQAEGQEVTSLCVGEPDFLPPPAILNATIQAVQDGMTGYTAVSGTADLRQAIADDLQRRKGVTYQAATDILVANGAKQAVFQGVLATVGPGDKVIIPAPYWPSYPEMVLLAGAEAVILPTQESEGYMIQPDALASLLKEHGDAVKLLILCNPCNPTGAVQDANRLRQLAALLNDYPQVAVLADEIYERLVYDTEHVSFASLPGMYDRTLTVNGFSKAYAMTGLRLGYLAAPSYLTRAATTIQSQLTSCAGSLSQAAGVAALRLVTDAELDVLVREMQTKRDYVLQRLQQMPHVQVAKVPEGAFYVLPDVSAYCGEDDASFCVQLLQEEKLALVPGSSFGAPGTVRISYATSLDELQVAMDKLQHFLQSQRDDGKVE